MKQPVVNVADFIFRYAKDCVGTHKYGTIKVYEGLATYRRDYENKYGVVTTFKTIDIPFLKGFMNFLLESKEISLKRIS